jgi:hypothetical protein
MQFFLFTISSNPPEINLNGFVVLNRGVNAAVSQITLKLNDLVLHTNLM